MGAGQVTSQNVIDEEEKTPPPFQGDESEKIDFGKDVELKLDAAEDPTDSDGVSAEIIQRRREETPEAMAARLKPLIERLKILIGRHTYGKWYAAREKSQKARREDLNRRRNLFIDFARVHLRLDDSHQYDAATQCHRAGISLKGSRVRKVAPPCTLSMQYSD